MSGEKSMRSAMPSEERNAAASLAHEINNPLDSVLNLLYLLEDEATFTERGRHYLTLATEEIQRVSRIARDVLNQDRELSFPRSTNVPRLLDSVIDLYGARFAARDISVKTRYRSDGDLVVYSGPLRQVFSNLLLNAVDAMPEGGELQARTTAAREWSGQQRHGLRVTIADNGSGISQENLHDIFESSFTTKGSAGSGFGLTLVRDVVRRHGGSLRVRSSTKSGRSGSVFTIFLPTL
jgi:two-component system NtrC family sensor kinase